jgi:hypothetical protein
MLYAFTLCADMAHPGAMQLTSASVSTTLQTAVWTANAY